MLKYIGEAMGLKFKAQRNLNELEERVQNGFVPGMGQIRTATYDSLPITVREMLTQMKKGDFNA